MLRYTVRPLSDRTWLQPAKRSPTRFTAKWTETLDLLERELEQIRGRDLVLEVDVQEKDIRNDGMLRANAAQTVVPVVVAFESAHGPLLYRCDRYETGYYDQGPAWQHNVRAVALTLQSLRAVDRYGATQRAEQYQGYKAIGAATPMPAAMTLEAAAAFVIREAELPDRSVAALLGDHNASAHAWRKAARRLHPDHGGDPAAFRALQDAKRLLDHHHRSST